MATRILERGNIYFFYRPRVQTHHPEGKQDIQRFYIVLSPDGKQTYRHIVMARKELPDVLEHDKYWGFVDVVERDPEPIRDELKEHTYETKTRGERAEPAARPVGEGVYAIVEHEDHTHLAYTLELGRGDREAQKEFNIREEADYIISVKNPEKPSPSYAGLQPEQKADFPKNLREKFGDRRFVYLSPPDFLDYPGAEILIIGAGEHPEEDLEIDLRPEKETEETAEIFTDLRLRKSENPVEPLFKGKIE